MSQTEPRPRLRPRRAGLYDPSHEHDACGVGFVANVKGVRSHQILLDAEKMLCHMDHRGARGSEANTGDGAGILTALPHEFLAKVAKSDLGAELPPPGRFAAGLVFLPRDEAERRHCKETVEKLIEQEGQSLVGWRRVPVEPEAADLGPTAQESMPTIEQLFVAAAPGLEGDAFERKLYLIRKQASHLLRIGADLVEAEMFYVCSLSTKVIVYKGMLASGQLVDLYPDLGDETYTSHLAMVHSRFSTNTFPSWDRAQPNRFMSHNGEINTLRGNMNWMHARQGTMTTPLFGDDLQNAFPIVEPDCSDSGTFDNALEFLLMSGRTLQAAIMMMIPEAWQNDDEMSEEKRAFYEYHSCLMEPWDGPASIAFTDGHYIGAVLDRNGLRPSRYYLTHDDVVIMASEVGVLPVEPERVKHKGRLHPGRMFLVDFEEGRIISDRELKAEFVRRRPYGDWLAEQKIELAELPPAPPPAKYDEQELLPQLQAFGYTVETLSFMLRGIVEEQRDPVGSMGNDEALAVLSDKPRMLYDYFKQLFAQVTNPAIDSIREEIVMSLECYIGPEGNLLDIGPEHAHRLRVPHPILTNEELASLRDLDYRGWRTRTIDITWDRDEGEAGMLPALERICEEAEAAIDEGYQLVVLSDRATGPDRVPIPSLLACGAVHHHLVRHTKRTRIGIVLESGEAREVHHHCLLVGFGADAINPYLAFETLDRERRLGRLSEGNKDWASVVAHYRKGVAKGMLKVMGKMGISTLQSYKGAQIFEAVGLGRDVMERCFAGTASRVQGVGFEVLAEEHERRHDLGYPDREIVRLPVLPNPGDFHWRRHGDAHMWDPEAIADLQVAARGNDETAYWRFARHTNEENTRRCNLRGLLAFKAGANGGPIDLAEVEPESEIVKRFATGAMSFGSISAEAHESLAIAMNRIGGKSNT
ncbi:MAG: glutamate synthase central domain-containing protein, partial [Thermoanaerobaculia bacterium]|nr:glutamate synthase central domain-containing protein [Thermoanaerobaculia bacterium]